MPLTIAHPSAVLPFRKSGFPLSALVVGSIAPDFEYMLHLAPRSEFSHTMLGLFSFCIPAGMLALWVFHRIWKEPMVAVLGEGHRAKPFPFGPFPRFSMLCCAILFGALTHVAWDSFTHEYGYAVHHLEGLGRPVHVGSRMEAPLFKILQHASTLLGCAALLFVAFHHRSWTWHAFDSSWRLIAVVGWMGVAGGVALGMLVAGDVSTAEGLKRWVGCGLVVGSAILVLVTTFLCLLWHVQQRR